MDNTQRDTVQLNYLHSPVGRCNPPPASHPPHPLIHAIHDITVVVKKVAQNPAVLASYYR